LAGLSEPPMNSGVGRQVHHETAPFQTCHFGDILGRSPRVFPCWAGGGAPLPTIPTVSSAGRSLARPGRGSASRRCGD